jgi:hypothetical protein
MDAVEATTAAATGATKCGTLPAPWSLGVLSTYLVMLSPNRLTPPSSLFSQAVVAPPTHTAAPTPTQIRSADGGRTSPPAVGCGYSGPGGASRWLWCEWQVFWSRSCSGRRNRRGRPHRARPPPPLHPGADLVVGDCHTCFSKENQVQTYMHALHEKQTFVMGIDRYW